jgi:hypothetical protein
MKRFASVFKKPFETGAVFEGFSKKYLSVFASARLKRVFF